MNARHFLSKYALILGLLWQPLAVGSQFSAIVEGDDWRWTSAHKHATGMNHVASSLWQTPSNHPAVDHIILGAAHSAPSQVNLSSNGQTYVLPIEMAGMEYRLDGVRSTTSETGALNTAITSAVGTGVAVVSVTGTGLSDQKITLDKTQAAIQGFRPILNIDTAFWAEELNSREAEPGEYTASFSVTSFYEYIRNGTRIRYIFTMPVVISFDFTPEFISEIRVTGSDEMQIIDPDDSDGIISAQTTYSVTATGYFIDRLLIGLKQNKNRELYSLKPENDSGKAILYSVTCEQCSENAEIIQNGVAQINNTDTFAAVDRQANPRQIDFDIKVSVDSIIQQNYEEETYHGSFVLMFELPI